MMENLDIKEKSDLYNQTQQKINFIGELLGIIRNNIDMLEIVNSPQGKNVDLVPRIITLKEINFHRDYYEDILDYFKDYGMCLYD